LETRKIRVGILFGGKSAEHEVSLQSAKNIVSAIDRKKYEVVLIGIDKTGRWLLPQNSGSLFESDDPRSIKLGGIGDEPVTLIPESGGAITNLSNHAVRAKIDVVFPILHGPFGEDGTVQGLLKLAGLPFVGASVLGSAIGMDKDVTKRLLRDAGIPVTPFLALRRNDAIDVARIMRELGLPLFVKPANLGSSVGVSKALNAAGLKTAIEEAFRYDNKVLVEAFADGREIECAVLGNQNPAASVAGEIIPRHEFYSYSAKYLDDQGAALVVPADIDAEISARVQALSIRTFKVLSCEGLARVDFFLKKDGTLLVNEINTIPGFTQISMFPRLWQASGISYSDLISRLIELAIESFESERKLKTGYDLHAAPEKIPD
jgi:D-alanine-D-alanine ligase